MTILCGCRKTKCLKKYCECFSRGENCKPSCKCVDCNNTELPQYSKKSTFCNCQKIACLKKYCECFKSKRTCSDLCKCINCKNSKKKRKPRESLKYTNNESKKLKLIICSEQKSSPNKSTLQKSSPNKSTSNTPPPKRGSSSKNLSSNIPTLKNTFLQKLIESLHKPKIWFEICNEEDLYIPISYLDTIDWDNV